MPVIFNYVDIRNVRDDIDLIISSMIIPNDSSTKLQNFGDT